jgi:UDP:flavonoid glycosyltransferase YjiC (YdhE family)
MKTRFTGESYHVPSFRAVHFAEMKRVAYFVSPHGFGHAARVCAVIAELTRRRPDLKAELVTAVPRWFFADSLAPGFNYHQLDCDVGLVQTSPLVEDVGATVERLNSMWRHQSEVTRVGRWLGELDCSLVVADISPLGLAAARVASIPSVLIESFTWDWIYANYPAAPQPLLEHGHRLAGVFESAGLRIQAEPVCAEVEKAAHVGPIARRARREKTEVRSTLGVPADEPMIVVSMGGVQWDYDRFSDFEHSQGAWIVVPGGSERERERRGRIILLPFHADIYHPDLVAASDVVVSKLGYSTVAETYSAGAALAYIGRPLFPESPVLARWVEERMVAAEISEQSLRNGGWLEEVDGLLTKPPREMDQVNGAAQAAEIILDRFESDLE